MFSLDLVYIQLRLHNFAHWAETNSLQEPTVGHVAPWILINQSAVFGRSSRRNFVLSAKSTLLISIEVQRLPSLNFVSHANTLACIRAVYLARNAVARFPLTENAEILISNALNSEALLSILPHPLGIKRRLFFVSHTYFAPTSDAIFPSDKIASGIRGGSHI